MPVTQPEFPYLAYCDECDWEQGVMSYSQGTRQVRLHEEQTFHDANKTYRNNTTKVARVSAYITDRTGAKQVAVRTIESDPRNIRSGHTNGNTDGTDRSPEEGS